MLRLHERLRQLPQITIGKITGLARGGGSELLLAMDMRFAAIADVLAATTCAPAIGAATAELVRTMIASAGQDDLRRNPVVNEALFTTVVTYIQQHLTDPGLSPGQIARANHISLRQLYKLWAHNQLSLAEWIMAERLEGAGHALAAPAAVPSTIMAVSHRWGFADSTHFSRRFRAAYGMSPGEWRQSHTRPA